MKNHIWRPLYLFVALIVAFLLIRNLFVPPAFGVNERGYTYGWYDKSNEDLWKAMPVNYRFPEDCQDCHEDNASRITESPHDILSCQNCHGPARDHPDAPKKLSINTDRGLCLRCHAELDYPTSERGAIIGIDPITHNPGEGCSDCHDPHQPSE